jgi:diguanylate cyclase (GGDEF)-like protein/PAS domain S-box-containing protein
MFKSKAVKVSLGIAVLYAFLGSLWIIFSGKLTALWVGFGVEYFRSEMFKGLAFIFVTAVILFFVVHHYLKKLERANKKAFYRQKRLKSLIDNVPGVIYGCLPDRSRTLKFISGQAQELTGYRPAQLINNREVEFAEIIHPEDRETIFEMVAEAVKEGETFTAEYRLVDSEGKQKWVKEKGKVSYDSTGESQMVEGMIESIADIKEAEESAQAAVAEAEFLAHYDTLTGLPSRGYFFEQITQQLQEDEDNLPEKDYAFIVVDLTDFRQLNDFYGYWVGNKVLQVCGRWLRNLVPEGAMLGRLGGDEFGIFLKMENHDDSRSYLEGLLEPYEHTLRTSGEEITFEIHAGVAFYPSHGKTLESVISAANRALTRGKVDVGQKRVYFYCPSDTKSLEERMQSADQVFKALADSRLEMHYQPIVNATDGSVFMQEALLRFDTGDGGMNTLGDYSEIVYEGRLTRQLDKWVIDSVLSQTKEVLGSEEMPLVSINIFPTSLLQSDFFTKLNTKMEKMNFPREKLVVEVTEQLLASHSEVAVQNLLNAAHDHGYRFALDDFGVGHGSFQTLKQFPVDYLKIDGSFILDLVENDVDQNFVQSISELCSELDITVIAEWIENKETAEKLCSLGVDLHQGYYYSWPKPFNKIMEITINGLSE